jgi:predicted Zn-dependent protease
VTDRPAAMSGLDAIFMTVAEWQQLNNDLSEAIALLKEYVDGQPHGTPNSRFGRTRAFLARTDLLSAARARGKETP